MQADGLLVYSAGAVAPPFQYALNAFDRKEGIESRFVAGKPENLLKAIVLNKKGDVMSCGAEYVHDEAEDRGIFKAGTRHSVGYRRSVLIVQEGNPRGINKLENLTEPGIRIGIAVGGCLKGVWDDVCSKASVIEEVRANIVEHADACGTLMGFIHSNKVDFVFGWNAFKNIWYDTCDAVELPRDLQIFRSTAVQVVNYTRNESLSRKLIEFLTSAEGQRIYSEYGWLHEPR
ncbi:MAG: substrate-binding domain-containing protein [Candidatus Bathyarchaeota archaeon]|nr:substrate-binding domain-containing protein [Candidatus Bathyarchaeota archaeon]